VSGLHIPVSFGDLTNEMRLSITVLSFPARIDSIERGVPVFRAVAMGKESSRTVARLHLVSKSFQCADKDEKIRAHQPREVGVYLSQVGALKMEVLPLEEAVVGAQTLGQSPVAARDLLQPVIPRYSGDSFETSPPLNS
jgi:hypothetical protein